MTLHATDVIIRIAQYLSNKSMMAATVLCIVSKTIPGRFAFESVANKAGEDLVILIAFNVRYYLSKVYELIFGVNIELSLKK